MFMTGLIRGVGAFLAVLVVATPAQANMMVPFVLMSWFGMLLALLPIMFAEMLILFLQSGLPFLRAMWVAVAANLVSTFIGIPLAVMAHAILGEMADEYEDSRIGRLLWAALAANRVLAPNENIESDYQDWMHAVAMISFFVIFFGGSWISEAYVAESILDEYPAANVWAAMGWVNAASYCGLAAFLIYVTRADWGRSAFAESCEVAEDFDYFENLEDDEIESEQVPEFDFDADDEDEHPVYLGADRQDAA